MDDIDVLKGCIKGRMEACRSLIKSKGMPESTKKIARARIDVYRDILKDIKKITKRRENEEN